MHYHKVLQPNRNVDRSADPARNTHVPTAAVVTSLRGSLMPRTHYLNYLSKVALCVLNPSFSILCCFQLFGFTADQFSASCASFS